MKTIFIWKRKTGKLVTMKVYNAVTFLRYMSFIDVALDSSGCFYSWLSRELLRKGSE